MPKTAKRRRSSNSTAIKLLCASDTHDKLPPELDEVGATAWLHAGDVYEAPSLDEDVGVVLAGWQDPDHPDVAAWASSRAVPVFAVRGNHDIADPFGFFTAKRNITGKVIRLADDLLVAGIGWAGDDIGPPLDGELAEVCARVGAAVERERREGDRVVVLSHYPVHCHGLFPDDAFGRLSDFCYRCVTELVIAVEPVLVVQGHIHQWFGQIARMKLNGRRSTVVLVPGPEGMVATLGAKVTVQRPG